MNRQAKPMRFIWRGNKRVRHCYGHDILGIELVVERWVAEAFDRADGWCGLGGRGIALAIGFVEGFEKLLSGHGVERMGLDKHCLA